MNLPDVVREAANYLYSYYGDCDRRTRAQYMQFANKVEIWYDVETGPETGLELI